MTTTATTTTPNDCRTGRSGSSRRSRAARALAAGAVLASTAALAVPAQAATTYDQPLRTAVRQLPVAAENNVGYDRTRYFGGWRDIDRDCVNTRHEVLLAEGTLLRRSSTGCTVVGGQWRSFYDGRTYTSPTQLQIDHLIPLAEAWGSGARNWTQLRRAQFSNDLRVGYALNAMPSALNASKAARGPEQWMPPANRCRYIEIWTAMKIRWQLRVDPTERAALVRYADGCPNTRIRVVRA